ncbi:hypothetical protein EX349_26865 [Pseudomonas protegens]|uniref:hypothetical protein n=1 Tax=Pseudomonas protegens TaxID=380021 RepID=UPI001372EA78|nr:hypothetical protein [Pseudomonas protegens]NAN54819.1 hypothetical protein [Pseudomonas protegens]NUE73825.1 hypothetical protein [Pseudomonas protegens]
MAIELDDVTQAAVKALKFVNSPTSFLLSAFEQTVSDRPDTDRVDVLREETVKRELEMRMAEAEARVAQELAIARRIETAEEVEMTEFFEYAGEGHAGLKANESSISVGVSGSGRRISKRKFVFKGGAVNYEGTSQQGR